MELKTYAQTLEYMYSRLPMFFRVGPAAYKKDLGNTTALCNAIGNPHEKFKSIHIAGTNGKGSVSHFIASVLQESGYKTALYTSPHLKDFRERIKVNGIDIPEDYVVAFFNNNQSLIESIAPSFFELTVAMAFAWFAENGVEYAVLETGLGGRLDSTNIVTPALSVITNVSYDHQHMLGNTLEEIAAEKAGIIKPGLPVVTGKMLPEALQVIQKTANHKNSLHFPAEDKYEVQHSNLENGLLHMSVQDKFSSASFEIASPLAGNYQFENILTVIRSIDVLQENGLKISKQNLLDGILKVKENTGLRGRWEILGSAPTIIADVAHNEAGLLTVFEQACSIPHHKLRIVYGMVQDKDIVKAMKLLPTEAQYYFCAPSLPRALPVNILSGEAEKLGLSYRSFSLVGEALEAAKKDSNENDLILITGSIFVVAEILPD